MGQRTGLDYSAVRSTLQACMPRTWRQLFAGVQVIERALLGADMDMAERAHDDAH